MDAPAPARALSLALVSGLGIRLGVERQTGEAHRLLRLLADVQRTLLSTQSLSDVLNRVVDLAFQAVPAERAFLMLTTALLAAPACAETAGIEKDELTLGFIKLTDMAPLAIAAEKRRY